MPLPIDMIGIVVLFCKVAFVVLIIVQTTEAVAGLQFTSAQDMEALAQLEHRLLNTLRYYISTQQAKLSLLKTKFEQIAKIWPPEQNTEKVVSDPINAFSLVRRLTREWPLILNFVMENVDMQEELSRLPEEDCMQSAIRGLTRLQEVYRLDTKRLTQAFRGSIHLTALDCLEVGMHLFKNEKYLFAASWLKESLNKISKNDTTVNKDKILPYLFLTTLHSDIRNEIVPGGDVHALRNLMSQYPQYTLDEETATLFRQTPPTRTKRPNESEDLHKDYYEQIFRRSCLGIGVFPSSELRCYYIHYNNPRLVIAPFKMEEQNLDPPILIFHDVISDQEITQMKAAFIKVRRPCATLKHGMDKPVISYYRTCEVGWVNDIYAAFSARLSQRIGDMTNLAMGTSEEHQVANYGLGGEFQLHFDPILTTNLTSSEQGSRLATFMIYLNDVESGGCTAFPRVNVTVEPAKGSAVFWFNLDHKSETLKDMLHGGCPILRGSKWVLNKWIHEGGQKSDMFCPADEIFPKKRYYLNGVK